jgi:hypothetical protein
MAPGYTPTEMSFEIDVAIATAIENLTVIFDDVGQEAGVDVSRRHICVEDMEEGYSRPWEEDLRKGR